jgi:serine/threonine protein kinase
VSDTNAGVPGVTGAVEIGRGGFGVVYKAAELDLGRDVAVKVLTGQLDDRSQLRFERERKAMGALSGHPNIVTIFRSGTTEERALYLVMEYLPGGSLAERVEQQGPLPVEDVLRIGVELAGALETAHRAGVLHRDIKPGNVMMDSLGRDKLGDFGIARLDGAPETKSAVVTASVAHAPPEVIAGTKPDERSDVYSLGSTLFELMNGAPAFSRPSDESMIPMFARIAGDPPPDLRQQGVPAVVAATLERSLAKQSEQRFASAAEFGRALNDAQRSLGHAETRLWLEGEPAPDRAPESETQIVPPPVNTSWAPPVPSTPEPQPPTQQPQTQQPQPQQLPPQQPAAQQPQPQQLQPVPQQPAAAYQPPPVPQQFAAPPTGSGGYPNQSVGLGPQPAPKKSNTGLIVASIIGVLLLVVGGASIMAASGGDDPEPEAFVDAGGSDGEDTDSTDSESGVEPDEETTTTTIAETTTTTEPPPTLPPRADYLADLPSLPSVEQPFTGYKTVTDAQDAFTVRVPIEWPDLLATDGQVLSSPDNNEALGDGLISGLVVSGSQGIGVWDADLFLDELLSELSDPDNPCSEVKREPYVDGPFDGLIYAELCRGGDMLVVEVLVSSADRESVILVAMQMTDERDMAAFEEALASFTLFDPASLPVPS